MSYYLGRSNFSSYRSSYDPGRYSSYSRSNYGSDSWRSGSSYSRPSYSSSSFGTSYSSYSSSNYRPRTYDFGGSSSLGSSYSSRYGADSSWRSRDYSSKGYSSTDDSNKDTLSNDNSTEEYSSKNDSKDKHTLTNGNDASVKDFSSQNISNSDLSKEGKAIESLKEYLNGDTDDDSEKDNSSKSKDPLVKDFSAPDSSKSYYSRSKEGFTNGNGDYLSKYSSDSKRRDYLDKYLAEDNKKARDDTGKVTNGDVNTVKDLSQTDGISSYRKNRYGSHDLVDSTTKLTLDSQGDPGSHNNKAMANERKATPNKKIYNFEDVVKKDEKENALFAEKQPDFDAFDSYTHEPSGQANGGVYRSPQKPKGKYSSLGTRNPTVPSKKDRYYSTERPKEDIAYSNPKTRGRTSSGSDPVTFHRPGIQKFISVVPEETNRYVTSVNYLPERIELRLCGMTPRDKKIKKWRSIPDLYNITLKPQQSDDEQIQCEEQTMAYAYDSGSEMLNYSLPRHEHVHMKEMYVTQYTHHFDPEEPRSHIAGWKVDVEPNGVPHERSRMCVLKHPVVSGPNKKRPPRPKSAPPVFVARPASPEAPIRSQKVDVVDRGYYTSPRSSRPSDNVFYNGYEDSTDASSLGYAPSDDTSDSSAFIDPRSPTSKDQNFSFSKPKLIRLSAEFPGIRNLEKMRRKRQSMGSATSPKPRSSLGQSPSPRDGEYGFFVALTSGNSPKVQNKVRSSSHY